MKDQVIEKARELAHAIEQNEEFIAFTQAVAVYESDDELQQKLRRYDALQKDLVALHEPEAKDKAVIDLKMQEFKLLRDELLQTPSLVSFMEAQETFNGIMNEVQGILQQVITGEDPNKCGSDCGGCSSCDSCGGGCH